MHAWKTASFPNFSVTDTYVTTPSVEEDGDGTGLFTGLLFNDVAGTPGTMFLGSLSGTADVGFSFDGRTPTIQTGTFPSTLTEFNFSGTVTIAGTTHTFNGTLDPSMPSTGTTTVTNLGADSGFEVSSFFDIFPKLSLDGGPFVPRAGAHDRT